MSTINDVTKLEVKDNIAILTLNSPPVNALSAPVREGLDKGIRQAIKDNRVDAIILICTGRTFIAGADISEFGKEPKGPSLFEVQDELENSPKPIIAAIHGTALGGGLEVALTCHYRIAVPSAKCGLPEVSLGLLPGAGGTQRLPRLVGVEQALKMVTSGIHLSADKCLKSGLIDKLANEGQLMDDSILFAKEILSENKPLIMGGTFTGNPLTLSSCNYLLDHLSENEEEIYTYIDRLSMNMRDSINQFCEEEKIAVRMSGIGSINRLIFSDQKILSARHRDEVETPPKIQSKI